MEFLPLGSIIQMQGAGKLFMIVARGLVIKHGGGQKYVDYGVVTYPEGLIGDRIYYVNRESISHVIAKGYSNTLDESYLKNLNRLVEQMPYKKAEPVPLGQEKSVERKPDGKEQVNRYG